MIHLVLLDNAKQLATYKARLLEGVAARGLTWKSNSDRIRVGGNVYYVHQFRDRKFIPIINCDSVTSIGISEEMHHIAYTLANFHDVTHTMAYVLKPKEGIDDTK